jgi:hypothetical protein
VTEPTRETPADDSADDSVDDERSDEDRAISDVGLPRPGDAAGGDGAEAVDEAALDAAFPPEDAARG